MIIYSPITGPRLRYVGDLIAYEIFGQACIYTSDPGTFQSSDEARINYSDKPLEGGYWIRPHGLLGEKGVRLQSIQMIDAGGIKAFFETKGEHPFDILSAIFYLLSRYEEYLPHEKDKYGRYLYTDSLAFRKSFLAEPLVNQWILRLKEVLRHEFPSAPFREKTFTFTPTYDIDEAWSFLHKSPLISYGGMMKDILKADWKRVWERKRVRAGKKPDPFDSYKWLNELHDRSGLKPRYFFLLAKRRSKYDRNISPLNKDFRKLVSKHATRYDIGIHPSWQSKDKKILGNEISLLEEISGKKIIASRHHFISFTLPGTFRELIDAGIQEEFSMGYGSINGFRASIASPFNWYDLEKEEQTPLVIYPFCFMDANSFFEQKQTPQEAIGEMMHYHKKVKAVGGHFISIWHNTFLGTDPLFRGWREAYENFVSSVSQSQKRKLPI